jgi:hypothetical protein
MMVKQACDREDVSFMLVAATVLRKTRKEKRGQVGKEN